MRCVIETRGLGHSVIALVTAIAMLLCPSVTIADTTTGPCEFFILLSEAGSQTNCETCIPAGSCGQWIVYLPQSWCTGLNENDCAEDPVNAIVIRSCALTYQGDLQYWTCVLLETVAIECALLSGIFTVDCIVPNPTSIPSCIAALVASGCAALLDMDICCYYDCVYAVVSSTFAPPSQPFPCEARFFNVVSELGDFEKPRRNSGGSGKCGQLLAVKVLETTVYDPMLSITIPGGTRC